MSVDTLAHTKDPVIQAIDDAVEARDKIAEALKVIDAKIANAMKPENQDDQRAMIAMRDSFRIVMGPADEGFKAGQNANLAVLHKKERSAQPA